MAMAPRAIFRLARCGMRRHRTSPDRCTGCLSRPRSPGTPSPSATGPARPSGRGSRSRLCCTWCCSPCCCAQSIAKSRRCSSLARSRLAMAAAAVAEGTAWRIFLSPRRAPAHQPPRPRYRLFRRRLSPHQHRHRLSRPRPQPWRRKRSLQVPWPAGRIPQPVRGRGPGAGLAAVRVVAMVPGRGREPEPALEAGRAGWLGVRVRARKCGRRSQRHRRSGAGGRSGL